jgi:hypothetical protein
VIEMAKWIQKATAGAHGQFAAKAKAAGKSTKEFAAEKAGAPGVLGKQARLASTLMGMHKGRSPSDKRKSRYAS